MADHGYELVPVGDVRLNCMRVEGDVWIDFRLLCEHLGLDVFHWQARLSHPDNQSAVKFRLSMRGAGGQTYSVPHIHYQSVPLWLCMVDLQKIASRPLKERIILIRRECAEAVRRHFFGASAAADAACSMPTDSDPFDLIIRCAEGLKRQRAEIERLSQRTRQNTELTLRCFENQTTSPRGRYFQVRVCCDFWGLPADRDSANAIGRAVKDTAEREGWSGEVKKDRDEQFKHVNAWPARRILRWFADRYGDCPEADIQELLVAEESASEP